ncbi:response regulator [Ilyomonas limi]|uniref:histidine kinase n=1 Tax=Ilyomonas limi TaxID=2575867 RepID=A0A4U3L1Z2_9BACT|nr:response regulator [Ilyomonas limi]TKK68900.1 response regulator [Ilyomonas limi]
MKNTFLRNLQIGFGLSLIILTASAVLSYYSISNLKKKAAIVNHTNIVLQQSERVMSLLKDAETGQRGYLLTGSDFFLKPYFSATENIYSSLDSLKALTTDNPSQQKRCEDLRILISKRLERLSKLIQTQKAGDLIDPTQLAEGQDAMDKARQVVSGIQSEENHLLTDRIAAFDYYNSLTSVVISIAALIAIIITIIFYRRVKQDYEMRRALLLELEEKDKDITDRINIIENVARQVALGNYKIRVEDEEKDNLGKLSGALNKMAQALEDAFEDLLTRDWSKTGIATLSDSMVGENEFNRLCQNIISFLAEYTDSQSGALYLAENGSLYLKNGYALPQRALDQTLKRGEGIAGQCAASGKNIVITNIPDDSIKLMYATGEIKPRSIIAVPVFFERELKAVVELASLNNFTKKETEFLNAVAYNIGTAIETSQRRTRLLELFQETQAQAEELQSQHAELEQVNTELEAQAQKLQVSEEELKVQQEELLQSNQELEERSTLLEEKNQMIVERNLEIQKKAEELEAATRYKSEFLANMSHELRTPLNSILLLSRLMAENNENNLTAEQVEYARVIQSSGNGLLTLIDEILDLSKIESGKMKLEFEPVSLATIADDMNALFAPMAKEKNLKFSIEVAADVPPQIITDAQRLEQILKNLFSNALKFTARGSVEMEVKATSNEHITFMVRDTGIGIPPDKQKLVFEAFQQADGSTRRKYGGTGLGLSICRELAKLLGGEIKLQSEPGKGSEFTVTIPVDGSNVAQHDNANTVKKATPEPSGLIVSTQQNGDGETPGTSLLAANIPASIPDDRDNIQPGDKVILIVEDDIHFAQTLLSFAQHNGYKAVVAVRGDHGVPFAIQYKPMAVLLDIVLPVKNGWQVMDDLKGNLQTRHIPVHMMSSLPYKEESLSKGALDFISKPVAFDKLPGLFESIEQALTRGPKKILIVEENAKHAQALCYFLESYNVNVLCTNDVDKAIHALQNEGSDCVVLDLGVINEKVYEGLEKIKEQSGLELLPIILFTGKNLSKTEEQRIKQVADSIVVKTANSYKRILDEIALFLHVVEENNPGNQQRPNKVNALSEVLENKTVLIADDDVRNIYSLTKALEAHRMNVVSATDGKEALEVLKENPKVNIVLMDMMMPEMDGYEATQTIRKMPQYRNLPVLAITAKAMYGDREKCIQAGASDYISKPVDIDQLISLLRVWLYDKL